MPFFRKLVEFQRVLSLNRAYLCRPWIEVVIALDENSEESELLELIRQHRDIRWTVVVNDRQHAWRPPCRAINVGIRHATGDHVLVMSPESAYVGDMPAIVIELMRRNPNSIAFGQVARSRFDELREGQSLWERYQETVLPGMFIHSFYGSICGPKQAFEAVGGYDEALEGWGGDDDNLRVRLEMAGYRLLACPEMRLLHLSQEDRTGDEQFDVDDDFRKCTPHFAVVNEAVPWGHDFRRVAYASDIQPTSTQSLAYSPVLAAPRNLTVIPTGSRKRCVLCGRLIHYTPPVMACIGCGSNLASINPAAAASIPPRIACVMQVRNEAENLAGCLAHLRDHVDGIIVLDDGSTDRTRSILESEACVVDCLSNPVMENHVWRETENKQRLVSRARELGFDWVLVCDADERYEQLFLRHLHMIAASFPPDQLTCVFLSLRELWGHPRQYRIDGVWDKKARARFFRLPAMISYDNDKPLHGQWYPDQVRLHGKSVRSRYQIYHLKSIRAEDREKRRNLYKALDPDNQFQSEGYDYLVEEGPGMRLESIFPGREYDYDTLPSYLRG